MLRLYSFSLVALTLFCISGCQDSPTLTETTKPSASQIELCRLRLYLGRQADIKPFGFQQYKANEDTIWFKFSTKVSSLPALFDSTKLTGAQFETVTKFENRYEMPSYSETSGMNPEWWKPENEILVGGRIDTPATEIMAIGVSNADGRENPGEDAIVYVLLKKV